MLYPQSISFSSSWPWVFQNWFYFGWGTLNTLILLKSSYCTISITFHGLKFNLCIYLLCIFVNTSRELVYWLISSLKIFSLSETDLYFGYGRMLMEIPQHRTSGNILRTHSFTTLITLKMTAQSRSVWCVNLATAAQNTTVHGIEYFWILIFFSLSLLIIFHRKIRKI